MDAVIKLTENLKQEIEKLKDKFICQWVPAEPGAEPQEFEYDVKAYCVLSHAAFEEYAEEISLIANKCAKDALISKNFSRATISLLLYYGAKLESIEDEEIEQDQVFDLIRKSFDDCAKKHSQALANNHGFSLKYLRKIFTPVGLDVPDTVKLNQSLKDLAEARGSFAHSSAKEAKYGRWKKADRPMTPEKALTTVADCLELCEEISKSLSSAIAQAIHSASVDTPTPPARPRLPG